MKQKACTIDHPFHKITHSFDFIRSIIAQEYEVDNLWDNTRETGKHISIEQLNEYEILFYFQQFNSFKDIKRIRGSIIWIPMYDDVTQQRAFWLRISTLPIKIICFSKQLYEYVCSLGVSALFVQYYLDPGAYLPVKDFTTHRVFFWFRGGVHLESVLRAFGDNKIDSMDLRWAPDPNVKQSEPNEALIEKYHINIIKGYLSREEYLSIVSRNNIFVAPRLKEGIGLSMLEAFTMGQCIVAHNDSTMNEYIRHGHNGILFDAINTQAIDLSNYETIAQQARKDSVNGWVLWQNDIKKIRDFIQSPRQIGRKKTIFFEFYIVWILIYDSICKNVRKISQMVQSFIFSSILDLT
jgi:glycosyltransferase involved in cell wall biosynthesis